MSHAVVGLLDEASEQRVERLWAQLDERFGVRAIRDRVPWPHVSFVVAEQIDESVPEIVRSLAPRIEPIALRAPSWTVFAGPPPILPGIVRAVLRLPALDAAHRRIAAAVGPHLTDVSPLTEHDEWNPHVTLAARDVGIERVGPVIRWLAENDHPAWEGRITRLGLIVDDNGRHGLACAHPLGGN